MANKQFSLIFFLIIIYMPNTRTLTRKTVRKPKIKRNTRTTKNKKLRIGIGGALMLPGSAPYIRF